jgi:hypothetical protein
MLLGSAQRTAKSGVSEPSGSFRIISAQRVITLVNQLTQYFAYGDILQR